MWNKGTRLVLFKFNRNLIGGTVALCNSFKLIDCQDSGNTCIILLFSSPYLQLEFCMICLWHAKPELVRFSPADCTWKLTTVFPVELSFVTLLCHHCCHLSHFFQQVETVFLFSAAAEHLKLSTTLLIRRFILVLVKSNHCMCKNPLLANFIRCLSLCCCCYSCMLVVRECARCQIRLEIELVLSQQNINLSQVRKTMGPRADASLSFLRVLSRSCLPSCLWNCRTYAGYFSFNLRKMLPWVTSPRRNRNAWLARVQVKSVPFSEFWKNFQRSG